MSKQFEVGDIVVFDETSVNYAYARPHFGDGPFQIVKLRDYNGHTVIKVIPGANPGDYGKREFTCSYMDIRPSVFLTAAYRALHETV